MSQRLYVLAGGGTGGHLAPGIAVAEELRRRDPHCSVRFVGAGRIVEQQMLAPTGFEYSVGTAVSRSDFRRRPLRSLTSFYRSLREARQLIRSDRPVAVVGLGGFASFPVVFAAIREHIPVWLLEQNVCPGRVTRWLSRFCPACVTFEATRRWLSRRAVVHVTGNPLRASLLAAARVVRVSDVPTLLILGGSQGSRQVTESALEAIEALRSELAGWHILHQTGPDAADRARAHYERLQIAHTVEPFVSRMEEWYSRATMAISRAGATTLCELAAFGIPAVLIPHPFAADDHQTLNARYFVEAGAALMVPAPRGSMQPVPLNAALRTLIAQPQQCESMRSAMRALAHLDAAETICNQLIGQSS